MATQREIKVYLWSVILLGGVVTLAAIVWMPWDSLGLRFLLLALITVGISSRLSVQIPRTNTNVTVSDTFIFLIMLLFGGPAAILVAATEGFTSGIRISKTPTIVLFNSAVMACATSLTVVTLSTIGVDGGTSIGATLITMSVMALVQYLSNTTLVGVGLALKLNARFWPTWKKHCLWTSITYFGGAAAACVISRSFNTVGLYALLVTIPIISIIYFTYHKYLEDIRLTSAMAEKAERERAEAERERAEAERERAEQAERHVEELSRYIEEQERTSKALQESKEHFRRAALHDALTGLPNRSLLTEHLKFVIDRTRRREHYMFAVLFLDLDRFKNVNDSLGHTIGDQLLIAIARRLEQCTRDVDTVARLGGDEFAILLDSVNDSQEAIEIADRVQESLRLPFNLSGHEVFTTASIGISLSTTGHDGPESILRDADTAMYHAKSDGKARHEVFDPSMHARASNLLQLENDLRRAIEREEFCVYYQPIVALGANQISGFEALVRWEHPEKGLIGPEEFICVAEETGLINAIGSWVLREACRQLQQWQWQSPANRGLTMAVNLSGKQFTQSDLTSMVEQILNETGLEPHCLKLEITESVVMENVSMVTAMLNHLKALGVQISIDDFGTGYSSLSYLHRFPIDYLKVDRSFVSTMGDSDESVQIVQTIMTLAKNLGMEVIAEGIETEAQLDQLTALKCEYGQGYYFSRPVDAETAGTLILKKPHLMLIETLRSKIFGEYVDVA